GLADLGPRRAQAASPVGLLTVVRYSVAPPVRLVAAAIAIALCSTAVVRAEETMRLDSVEVEGRLSEPKRRLLDFLGLKPGAPFGSADQERVGELLTKLGYRLLDDRISNVGGGRVHLRLVLEPIRIVRNLIVRHNWPLFDDEIVRHLSVRTGQQLP